MKSKLRFLHERARELRRDQTDAEDLLWHRLRNRQCADTKFRRQYLVHGYIADFCAPEAGLIIELDGGQHAELLDEDLSRTQVLEAQGYRVLRFWNQEVLTQLETVLEVIFAALNSEGDV